MSAPHVFDGATFPLNTYVGHTFQLREVPNEHTGVCESEDQTCRVATFTVTENDDQGNVQVIARFWLVGRSNLVSHQCFGSAEVYRWSFRIRNPLQRTKRAT